MSSTGAIPKGLRPKSKEANQDGPKTLLKSQLCDETIKDPIAEPLEKKEIATSSDGIQIKRRALDSYWVEKRAYIPFSMPPQPEDSGDFVPGAVDAWVEKADFLIEDLTWILSLPYHRFWSQMMYDASFHECLESYLSERSRWYEEDIPQEKFTSYLASIHNMVFLIYVRMATYKESKENHITPSTFGHLIYQHFLFDICKMTDLSGLYGASNGPLLKKMFDNIFTHQPKYYNDLSEFVSSLKKVLENLESTLGLSKLSMCLNSHYEKPSLDELNSIVDYVVDIFFSLDAFLNLFPNGAESFRHASFDVRLATFYEKIIPSIVKSLRDFGTLPENELWVVKLTERLSLVRLLCLSVFRKIVENACCCLLLQDISQEKLPSHVEACMEKFVHTFTTCVEEKTFITDYASTFSIEDDIRLFADFGVDMTTLYFVHEAVTSTVTEVKMSMDVQKDNHSPSPREETSSQPRPLELNSGDSSGMNGYYSGETSQISLVELASLISGIKDLLPDLGSGFIKDCLAFYDYSSEEVLNAILENNLPAALETVPRDKKLVEEQVEPILPKEEKDLQTSETNEDQMVVRTNVYDDDEFDVFSRSATLNLQQIHKGKRKTKFQRDSSFTSKVKEIGHQYESNLGYSIYEDETKYMPIQALTYEDEYDDTYDDNEAGDLDDFALDKRKPSIPTLRGTGALNVPGLDFMSNAAEESGDEDATSGDVREQDARNISSNSKDIREYSGNFRRQHRIYQGKPENKHPGNSLVFESSKFKKGPTRSNPHSYQNGDVTQHNAKDPQATEEVEKQSTQTSRVPFCENPEELRRRAEERRVSKMERKRNYRSGVPHPNSQDDEVNHSHPTSAPSRGGGYPKTHRGGGRNSRHTPIGDSESSKPSSHGKQREDTQDGQEKSYRYKTAHKNQDRRRAAQNKYRGGF